jgi:hypothetical protein
MTQMKKVEHKLNILIRQTRPEKELFIYVTNPELFKLPTHLRTTIQAIIELGGSATTEDLALLTGRVRQVESQHANNLVRLGWFHKGTYMTPKKRKGIIFKLIKEVI